MTILPRNKQLRGLLVGGAAVSAVMAGPILVDTTAQAQPQASCAEGGVCLTPVTSTVPATTTVTKTTTVPVTSTYTTTVPVTTTTTVPVTSTTTVTKTTTVPVTSTYTTTVPVTSTQTQTQTTTVTSTATTGPTVTVTVTTTRSTSSYTNTYTNTLTGTYTGTEYAVPADRRGRPALPTTTESPCGTPGSTQTLTDGQVETCAPNFGRVAVYATAPGLYNKIYEYDSSYYASVGLFAPQYSRGALIGCYYVPSPSSVTPPGATVSTAGTLGDAVAFGLDSQDVSYPVAVPRGDCSSS